MIPFQTLNDSINAKVKLLIKSVVWRVLTTFKALHLRSQRRKKQTWLVNGTSFHFSSSLISLKEQFLHWLTNSLKLLASVFFLVSMWHTGWTSGYQRSYPPLTWTFHDNLPKISLCGWQKRSHFLRPLHFVLMFTIGTVNWFIFLSLFCSCHKKPRI